MQSVSHMGDGTTTEFEFNFPYYENSNILVDKNGAAATGYNIEGISGGLDADIPYTGGKVVFEIAPTDMDCITISRHLPLVRTVDYQPTEKIEPTILNQDMNYLMELLKDQSTELVHLSTQYAEIADKESTATLLARIAVIDGKITAVNQNITDFYTALANGRIMSRDDFYSYTTNCLTKIPQDIKLELNNGTLTLKAGSKIYKPNGVGNFDVITTTVDRTATQTNNGITLLMYNEAGYLNFANPMGCVSGDTDSLAGQAWHNWYDTTNNQIKGYGSDPDTVYHTYSFPLAVITTSNGAISSIDQIFNGFGYIGSSIFALPGVSGLVPNGRNADGTLNNTTVSITSVQVQTLSGTYSDKDLRMSDNGIATSGTSTVNYSASENKNYMAGAVISALTYGKISVSSDAITSITFKNVLVC